ncbi:MAG TPA: VCBS repeat-containing protein, partial [Caldilinea sp.]|nr:VCBS repeat-containing protein [Caldilinea sp.]
MRRSWLWMLLATLVLTGSALLLRPALAQGPGSSLYLPLVLGGAVSPPTPTPTPTPPGIQPPVLKWQRGGCFASWCQTGWYASPAVADLDGDGTMEVIAAAHAVRSPGAIVHRDI